MTGGPSPHVGVFAVEDTRAQLTWRGLRAGGLRLEAIGGEACLDLDVDAGPGAVVLDGLPAGRPVVIRASGSALGGSRQPVELTTRTLDALPGEELCRVATVSDLHLGTSVFGQQGTISESPRPAVLHPVRCAEAAFAEAAAWGAQRLLVKGDITNKGATDQWRSYAGLVRDAPFPVDGVPGNHDRGHKPSQRSMAPEDAAAAFGLSLALPLLVRDEPGLRVVLVDSTTAGLNRGHLGALADDVLDAVAEADRGGSVLVALHHQLQPHVLSEGWPIGVPRRESRDLLARLGAAHPRVLVTSGHTHRHRRWAHGGATATQVGSTKDYPGVWAGYVAHEGGLRQVVRRVGRPDCLRWTDHTRRAALGTWRWVSPGPLSSRCFDLTGPGRA